MPGLIKFSIIGNMSLRRKSQQLSPQKHRSAIVKPAPERHRHSHHTKQVQFPSFFHQLGKAPLRSLNQRGVPEKIAAGVAGDSQFRKDHRGAALLCRLPGKLPHSGDIGFHIGNPCFRRRRSNSNQTVFHRTFFLSPGYDNFSRPAFQTSGYTRITAQSPAPSTAQGIEKTLSGKNIGTTNRKLKIPLCIFVVIPQPSQHRQRPPPDWMRKILKSLTLTKAQRIPAAPP